MSIKMTNIYPTLIDPSPTVAAISIDNDYVKYIVSHMSAHLSTKTLS